MAVLLEELRFAARLLRGRPGFTAVALVTLALAIGANTAIFSVVNAVMLRPLPFAEPHRLFQVVSRTPEGGFRRALSAPQYLFISQRSQPLARLTAFISVNPGFNLTGDGPPERVLGAQVTQPFFEVLGIAPMYGRGFLPEEDVPGGPRVTVLGHGLWQRRFGGNPEAVGQSITLNGERYTIIGIAPPGFHEPGAAQLWTPLMLDPASTEDTNLIEVLGRLSPEVELEQVSSLLAAQSGQLRESRPGALRPEEVLEARDVRAVRLQQVRPTLRVLLGAVGCVLLIACVNLANLQLAQTASRARELAVRAALGASPARIMRQVLTESLLLAGAGGALGVLLASGALPALLALAPAETPLPEKVGLDGTVLGVTLAMSVLTGVLSGLLPAWQASHLDLQGALKASASSVTSGPAAARTRKMLVVCEMALVVILLIAASLLMKSFAALSGVAPGINPENVLTMKLSLPGQRYGTPAALESFTQQVIERVGALPEAEAVGFASSLPFERGGDLDFLIEGRPRDARGTPRTGNGLYRAVTPGYFDALRMGLVHGRLLADRDRHGGKPVVLINEAAERLYWPTQDPLGQRITIGHSIPQLADPEPREIIGVVRDVHESGLGQPPPAILYVPMGQVPAPLLALQLRLLPANLLVRSSEDPALLAAAVQRELQAVDPAQPVTDIVGMEAIVSRSLGSPRFNTLLLGLMAGLALVLAAVGIYGVLSSLVTLRVREIGVRLALGSTRGQVVLLVLRQGLSMAGIGVALGVVGALGLTRLLEHLLYSVSARDPEAFVAGPAVAMGVALLATWVPAHRASRVDAMITLKTE